MFNACKVFNTFGILPYKLVKNKPVFCPKRHIYCYIFASFVVILSFFKGLWYSQPPLNTKNSNVILMFLLNWEPMFYFIQICVIYSTVINEKRTKRAVKIVKLLFEVKSSKCGQSSAPEDSIIRYTYVSLFIILVMCVMFYYIRITQPNPRNKLLTFLDFMISYISTVVNTIQILQFCVYFEVINCALSELECSFVHRPIAILSKIKILRKLKNKIEHLYYPHIIFLQFSCLFYCILSMRAIYDLMSELGILALFAILWLSYDIPFQFYLMHLSEETNEKASLLIYLVL